MNVIKQIKFMTRETKQHLPGLSCGIGAQNALELPDEDVGGG